MIARSLLRLDARTRCCNQRPAWPVRAMKRKKKSGAKCMYIFSIIYFFFVHPEINPWCYISYPKTQNKFNPPRKHGPFMRKQKQENPTHLHGLRLACSVTPHDTTTHPECFASTRPRAMHRSTVANMKSQVTRQQLSLVSSPAICNPALGVPKPPAL